MLKKLTINNIVLINQAQINFANGLCILSGETGSGKSILLDALGLAIGFRSNFRLIGQSKNYGQVTAEFDIKDNVDAKNFLQENDLIFDDENTIIIRRTIKENSTSRAFINDNPVGVNLLAKLGEFLVEIHGQNDQRGLLDSASHLKIVDNYANNQGDLSNLKKIYDNFVTIDNKILDLIQKEDFYNRERDYLEHVIKELEDVKTYQGEENELSIKKDNISGKDKSLKFLKELKNDLLQSNSNLIAAQRYFLRNQHIIEQYISDFDNDMQSINNDIDNQIGQIDSNIGKIDSKISEISNFTENLDEIEERLFLIRSLARKHNIECDKLSEIYIASKQKLSKITFDQSSINDLQKQRQDLCQKYKIIAHRLYESRKKAANELSIKVEDELKFLKMGNVKFEIQLLNDNSKDLSATGFDKVFFKASINNKNFDNIAKIASGGELSRFMLALKVAISNNDVSKVMIFDEIDTGIGGSVADAVGIRLKLLAKDRQILVVTHQPQIAAKSDFHLQISKVANDSMVNTIITILDDEKKQHEIARMLSGENISQEALNAAKILISNKL